MVVILFIIVRTSEVIRSQGAIVSTRLGHISCGAHDMKLHIRTSVERAAVTNNNESTPAYHKSVL